MDAGFVDAELVGVEVGVELVDDEMVDSELVDDEMVDSELVDDECVDAQRAGW